MFCVFWPLLLLWKPVKSLSFPNHTEVIFHNAHSALELLPLGTLLALMLNPPFPWFNRERSWLVHDGDKEARVKGVPSRVPFTLSLLLPQSAEDGATLIHFPLASSASIPIYHVPSSHGPFKYNRAYRATLLVWGKKKEMDSFAWVFFFFSFFFIFWGGRDCVE